VIFLEIFFGVAFGIVAGFLLIANFQFIIKKLKNISIILLLLSAIFFFAGLVYLFREPINLIINKLALILISVSIFFTYYFAKGKVKSFNNFINGGTPWCDNEIYSITRFLGVCVIFFLLLCTGIMLLVGIKELLN
jgi:hypothetical protein